MSDHDVDAVVKRLAVLMGMWRDGASAGEAISSIADPDMAVVTLCLTLLQRGDRLPGGLCVVPEEPTPQMLARVLPNLGVDHAPHTRRLAESALFHLEPKDFPVESHRSGIDAALALISDYRAMLAASSET